MISNEQEEGWHYLAVKKLSASLHGITWKHKGEFYCLNCLHSFTTEKKLKSHENMYIQRSLWIVMPPEKDKILEFNQYIKSDKILYIIYANIESLIKKK